MNENLAKSEALRDKLTEEIAVLTKEIDELKAALEKTTKERNDESAENAATISEAQEGQAAVEQAIGVLEKFYKTAAKAEVFVQVSSKQVLEFLVATVKGDVHDIGKNVVAVVLGCPPPLHNAIGGSCPTPMESTMLQVRPGQRRRVLVMVLPMQQLRCGLHSSSLIFEL